MGVPGHHDVAKQRKFVLITRAPYVLEAKVAFRRR